MNPAFIDSNGCNSKVLFHLVLTYLTSRTFFLKHDFHRPLERGHQFLATHEDHEFYVGSQASPPHSFVVLPEDGFRAALPLPAPEFSMPNGVLSYQKTLH